MLPRNDRYEVAYAWHRKPYPQAVRAVGAARDLADPVVFLLAGRAEHAFGRG